MSTCTELLQWFPGEVDRLNTALELKREQITELKIEVGRLLARLKRHKVEASDSEDD